MKMMLTAFLDAHQGFAVATGKLPRYGHNSACEMPSVLEFRSIANSCHNCSSGFRTDTLDIRGSLTSSIAVDIGSYLLIERSNPTIQLPEEVIQPNITLRRFVHSTSHQTS
jgi:hypothetical protein